MSVLSKIKGAAKTKTFKAATCATVVSCICVMFALSAFAAEPDSTDMSTVLQSSLTEMLSNIMKYLGVCLPIALTVFGTFFAIKWAINFFRGVASKGGGS